MARTFEQLCNEMQFFLRVMERLNTNTGKLPIGRRTSEKRQITVEEMNNVYLDAVQKDTEIKTREEYPNSDYQQAPTLELITGIMKELKQKIKVLFASEDKEEERTIRVNFEEAEASDAADFKRLVSRAKAFVKIVERFSNGPKENKNHQTVG